MPLTHLLSLADPALHILVPIILISLMGWANAATPFNNCPSGQYLMGSWANIGLNCAQIDYSQLTGTPAIPTVPTNVSAFTNDVPYLTSVSKTFSSPTRVINTAYQISSVKDAYADYSVTTSCTSVIIAGQNTTVTLQYADDSGQTTNVKTVNAAVNSTSGVLNAANQSPGNVHGFIPAGKYAKIVTSTTGSACTVSIGAQQEVLF